MECILFNVWLYCRTPITDKVPTNGRFCAGSPGSVNFTRLIPGTPCLKLLTLNLLFILCISPVSWSRQVLTLTITVIIPAPIKKERDEI